MNEELFGLLGIDPERLRQQQMQQGLLNAGLQMLAASGPSSTPTGLGQIVAQGGMAGLQGYQSAGEGAIDRALKGIQAQQVTDKLKSTQRIRELSANLYGPEGQINQNVLRQIGAIDPSRAKDIAGLETGQTEFTTIYDTNTGKEVKVQFNKLTGEYKQIGGAKAENLLQVDAGDRIEFRNSQTGNLVGSTLKGATPTAPSYTLTDAGILNTRTGQLSALPEGASRKFSEGEQKQITGVQNTRNAISEFKSELDNFTRLDSLRPKERAKIETKYRNMLMQAKEAYNLGVLNGPDLAILEQIIYNPTSMSGIVVGKDAIKSQAEELDRIMANIKTTVQAKGGEVPLQQPAPKTGVAGKAPSGVAQNLWDLMTPEERKLWQK